jgi:hypothetical protein
VAKVTCDNCELDALYTCADPGVNPVNYCGACLPTWLQDRADSGHFPLVESIDKTKKKSAAEKAAETKAEDEAKEAALKGE